MVNEAGMFADDEYTRIQQDSRAAADVVLPFVLEYTGAKSLIDIGCGVGTWLASAAALGVSEYHGVDGSGALSLLQIPSSHFEVADLREPLPFERQFDLAMSVETAEHLPANVAARFVTQLTNLAPQVLFSAAIPGQRGYQHINEQWPSYWAALFAEQRYRAVDIVRPRFWDDSRVPFWYRQNMLLYVREDRLPADYTPPTMLDVVHPELFDHYTSTRYVTPKMAVAALADTVKYRLGMSRR